MSGDDEDLDLDSDEENEIALVPVGRGRQNAVTLLDVSLLVGATRDAQALFLGKGLNTVIQAIQDVQAFITNNGDRGQRDQEWFNVVTLRNEAIKILKGVFNDVIVSEGVQGIFEINKPKKALYFDMILKKMGIHNSAAKHALYRQVNTRLLNNKKRFKTKHNTNVSKKTHLQPLTGYQLNDKNLLLQQNKHVQDTRS
jgi:hypothetical protein